MTLSCDILGSSRVTLTNCGQESQDCSIVIWVPIGFNDSSSNLKAVRVNKSSSKAWKKFIQWLRHERVCEVRDFKSVSE